MRNVSIEEAREWAFRSTTEYVEHFNLDELASVVDLQHSLRRRVRRARWKEMQES